jgi:hypothetical protein
VEAYVERIAIDDERAERELETFALEGLNSGDPISTAGGYWEEKHERLRSKTNRSS